MRFHFDGKIAPLLERVSFIKGDLETILNTFMNWYAYDTDKFKITLHNENFESLVNLAFPFQYPYKLFLVTTKNNWVAAFSNKESGESPNFGILSKSLNTTVVKVTAILKDYDIQTNGWGGGIFEIIDKGEYLRNISLLYDEKWDFQTFGNIQPFEDPNYYNSRFAKNRFTPEILAQYCNNLKIDFFNEEFYLPAGTKAYMIEHIYPPNPQNKPITLEEAQKARGLIK